MGVFFFFLKVSINELLLKHTNIDFLKCGTNELNIVVYDHNSEHTNQLDLETSYTILLLKKLSSKYHSVSFLTGGMLNFQLNYPQLCTVADVAQGQATQQPSMAPQSLKLALGSNGTDLSCLKPKQLKFTHSLSTYTIDVSLLNSSAAHFRTGAGDADGGHQKMQQEYEQFITVPSLMRQMSSTATSACEATTSTTTSVKSASQGPTEILSFLYLGSQDDALSESTLKQLNITNVLNVSATCPKPDFIDEAHFLRISINDGHAEKILPFFDIAFKFIGKYVNFIFVSKVHSSFI